MVIEKCKCGKEAAYRVTIAARGVDGQEYHTILCEERFTDLVRTERDDITFASLL